LLAACAVVGVAAAFVLGAASAGAGNGTDTTTATTEPPPTTTEPPTTTAPPPPVPTIPPGVEVGGIAVGGLTRDKAATKLRRAFDLPLPLRVEQPGRTLKVTPGRLGVKANIRTAIESALIAPPWAAVRLPVAVSFVRVQQYVKRLGRDFDAEAVEARVVFGLERPRALPPKPGHRILVFTNAQAIVAAFRENSRRSIRVAAEILPGKRLGDTVVIYRETHRLYFFRDGRFSRVFGIAVGQPRYPTPLGSFTVVTKQRNPWWYPPPDSAWAQGKEPVPPGPGNPLGTRWMGISARYVGIHGTPDAASIGYSASHGCIRMRIPDAEWLFDRVKVGIPVHIVGR
jgi:lipoprotein-anchoring transpeptidase ErfK/SrfK